MPVVCAVFLWADPLTISYSDIILYAHTLSYSGPMHSTPSIDHVALCHCLQRQPKKNTVAHYIGQRTKPYRYSNTNKKQYRYKRKHYKHNYTKQIRLTHTVTSSPQVHYERREYKTDTCKIHAQCTNIANTYTAHEEPSNNIFPATCHTDWTCTHRPYTFASLCSCTFSPHFIILVKGRNTEPYDILYVCENGPSRPCIHQRERTSVTICECGLSIHCDCPVWATFHALPMWLCTSKNRPRAFGIQRRLNPATVETVRDAGSSSKRLLPVLALAIDAPHTELPA